MDILIADVEKFVVGLLNENLDPSFVYHNLAHTQQVVAKTKEMIEGASLKEEDATALIIAAWFHDTGYTQKIEGHEKVSVEIATSFLTKQKAEADLIKKVTHLIAVTKMDFTPKSELEKIIRDADCAHIGSKNFSDSTQLLRNEWKSTTERSLSESEWLDENIDFLTNKHRFHTNFAALNWGKNKSKNLAQLLKAKKKLEQEGSKRKQKKEELDFKKKKVALPERGIETMFRVTLRNHITLSDIADTKANILLSVNAIIVSLVLSNLVSKLDNPSNRLP